MTVGRSLALAVTLALVMFFVGVYVGGRHRTCTYALSVHGWVPVCSTSFESQMRGN